MTQGPPRDDLVDERRRLERHPAFVDDLAQVEGFGEGAAEILPHVGG